MPICAPLSQPGFGEETEHISGLFVPSVDATIDSRPNKLQALDEDSPVFACWNARMSSPQTEERTGNATM